MSRGRGEALSNLKLDRGFFQRIVQKQSDDLEGVSLDYDIYLMEKGVMPVVLQGLDALSRHVEKLEVSGGLSGGGKAPFNPLTWLAQYLLRNHPEKVKDHRTPIYGQLSELSSIERGRRCLLRRRPEIEEEWVQLEANSGEAMDLQRLPLLIGLLDERWGLDGAFVDKMPADFAGVLQPSPEGTLAFADFWDWYESHVSQGDLLRASVFDDAARRREELELSQRAAQEELLRHELKMREVLEIRRSLENQFASISADLYTNDIVSQIINKSCVLQGVQELGGGPLLEGDHIGLIVDMLGLWGFPADPPPGDAWTEAAREAWGAWVRECGPEGASMEVVDSASLRLLIDREAFQAFLVKAHPAPEICSAPKAMGTVEVRQVLEAQGEELADIFVEAVDEDSGEVHRFVLPESQAEEVRRRLAAGGEPVLARVDTLLQRVTSVLPPEG